MLFLLLFTTISAMGERCQRHDSSSTVCSDGSKQQIPIVAGKSLKPYWLKKIPVKYYTNKSAILTTTNFMELLTALDASI
jgi:hypothetical protein